MAASKARVKWAAGAAAKALGVNATRCWAPTSKFREVWNDHDTDAPHNWYSKDEYRDVYRKIFPRQLPNTGMDNSIFVLAGFLYHEPAAEDFLTLDTDVLRLLGECGNACAKALVAVRECHG